MCSSPHESVVVARLRHHHLLSRSLFPPSFVDCCFKRRKKPLLPTVVSSLSSRPPSLVGCFRCPLPPTPAHSRHFPWQTSSAVCCPHSRRFDIAVVVAGFSRHRRDAASGPPPLRSRPDSLGVTRSSDLQSSTSWVRDNTRSPSSPPPPPLGTMPMFVVFVLVMMAITPPFPAVEGVLPTSPPEQHDDPPWKLPGQ